MTKCPTCGSEETFHNDTEDPEMMMCSKCLQEFYPEDEQGDEE